MKTVVVLDFETRSKIDLTKAGAAEYARHPSTEVTCAAWLMVGNPIRSWCIIDSSDGLNDLKRLLKTPGITWTAHNAIFEQLITRHVLGIDIPPDRWICTAALAASLALPRSLEGAGAALGLAVQKDIEGRKLMLKYSKPRRSTGGWWDNPTEFRRLLEYCKRDVEVEAELLRILPAHAPLEREIWVLDQVINHRGFKVDRETVINILRLIEINSRELDREVNGITLGVVTSTRQVKETKNWLYANGVQLPDLRAKTIQDALSHPIRNKRAKRVLEIRQESSKSSTAKYIAFELRSRSAEDGRVRDNLLYHAASTGRWGGHGVQPQNFPRGTLSDSDSACEVLKDQDLETIKLLYGNPMEVFSSCLRGMIIASEGKEFFCADYNAIETRVLFWIASHTEGLKAFQENRDLYKEMAAVIYDKPIAQITSEERRLGKQAILGCLAKGTRVLTKKGFKCIEEITDEDEVWEGKIWTKHGGLQQKGFKSVMHIPYLNLFSTPDHWFLLNGMWQTAVEIDSNSAILPRQLEQRMGLSSPSVVNLKKDQNAVSMCAAYAELKKQSVLTIFTKEQVVFVELVLNLLTDKKVEIPEMQISFLIQNLDRVGLLVSIISGNDVSTLMTKTSRGMAVAELPVALKTPEVFWNTLLRCAGLINGVSPWTELITTEVMKPETYELLVSTRITKIAETYDLKNVGVNNRFQVENILSHNCGYQMGGTKFHATCMVYGMDVDAGLAHRSVKAYRNTHHPVTRTWALIEKAAIGAVRYPQKVFGTNRTRWFVKGDFLHCELPSGRCLAYYKPQVKFENNPRNDEETSPRLYHWGTNSMTHKWEESATYGGHLVENVVQAISRDLLAEAMLRIEKSGYDVVLTCHDEILAEQQIGKGSISEFEELMCVLPKWATSCPVKAEGWKGFRYRK